MSSQAHISVLAEEVVDLLRPASGQIVVDGTLGAGGHSEAILERSGPDGKVVGIDRDEDALAIARERLARFGERALFVHGTFARVDEHLAGLGIPRVHGLLLDLGVSSMQLDRAERGFSFAKDGPIDMRMDPSQGESALDLIRRLGVDQLAEILKEYGEERYSRRIAQRLKDAARDGGLSSTLELADVVSAAIPGKAKHHLRIHPATRTFQALRIAVNGELDQLIRFLEIFPDLLEPGGRCAIISFHSLEDRLVKRCFRELAWTSSLPPEYARAAGERVDPICIPITKKPVVADEEEISRNPRARSAKLRVCERAAA
jgi:16S rRNA (cytosine1402-N4)-methyltransferase